MDILSNDASDKVNDSSNVIEMAAYQKSVNEVQSMSAKAYTNTIKSMESKANHSLPDLFISVSCIQELTADGMAIRELLNVGIPVHELVASGFTSTQLLNAGIYPEQLLAAGFSTAELGMRAAS